MVINILLVVGLFAVPKRKLNPYAAAAILGAIKAALYLFGSGSVIVAAIMGLIFFALASGFVYFMARAEARVTPEELRSRKGPAFKWEYIFVTLFMLLLIFGEFLLI